MLILDKELAEARADNLQVEVEELRLLTLDLETEIRFRDEEKGE